jgi:hypothetical protein
MTELRYGGSSSFTVQHVLNMLDDHVEMIEDLNTNGVDHYNLPVPETQEAANYKMRNYIDAISAYLAWDGLNSEGEAFPPNTQPDVVSYMDNGGDDSAYITAMALGEAYITENS